MGRDEPAIENGREPSRSDRDPGICSAVPGPYPSRPVDRGCGSGGGGELGGGRAEAPCPSRGPSHLPGERPGRLLRVLTMGNRTGSFLTRKGMSAGGRRGDSFGRCRIADLRTQASRRISYSDLNRRRRRSRLAISKDRCEVGSSRRGQRAACTTSRRGSTVGAVALAGFVVRDAPRGSRLLAIASRISGSSRRHASVIGLARARPADKHREPSRSSRRTTMPILRASHNHVRLLVRPPSPGQRSSRPVSKDGENGERASIAIASAQPESVRIPPEARGITGSGPTWNRSS